MWQSDRVSLASRRGSGQLLLGQAPLAQPFEKQLVGVPQLWWLGGVSHGQPGVVPCPA